MKKVVLLVMVLVFSGCTPASVEFMESVQVEGQHEKALKILDPNYGKGTVVFEHTQAGRECLKQKLADRGFYKVQDDIDCSKLYYNNVIK